MTTTATTMPTKTQSVVVVPSTVVSVTPLPEAVPALAQEPTQAELPWWQVLGLVGLMIVIASASVVDPRPGAIYRLVNSMKQIMDSNHLDSSQVGD
jgi:carbohydrate-binding DOMON domain-containing protein